MAEYITELANDIAKSCPDLVENGCGNDNCVACLAFKLIGLGYKKQTDTADVVPKSEGATELFADLEKILCLCDKDGCLKVTALYSDYAELKKKHTEEKL